MHCHLRFQEAFVQINMKKNFMKVLSSTFEGHWKLLRKQPFFSSSPPLLANSSEWPLSYSLKLNHSQLIAVSHFSLCQTPAFKIPSCNVWWSMARWLSSSQGEIFWAVSINYFPTIKGKLFYIYLLLPSSLGCYFGVAVNIVQPWGNNKRMKSTAWGRQNKKMEAAWFSIPPLSPVPRL
jgi:hypothetical protein